MHTLAWILLVWGASAEPEFPLGDAVAIYTSEEKCVAAGVASVSAVATWGIDWQKHAPTIGKHYRCVSFPIDPPLGQSYDARDFRTVEGRGQ